jgi:predicted MFS family arabinose efflux permease
MTLRLLSLPRPLRVRFQLVALAAMRTVLNTGYRMVYPFQTEIARGLGVELHSVSLAISARNSLGLVSPLLGSNADRWGRKAVMVTGMLVFAGAMLVMALAPSYPAFVVALLLTSVGKIVFDPALQAYIGDRVPYSQRGLAIAIVELSWSAAFLVGIPAAGWLMARSGWNAPFPWLAALGVGVAVVLWLMLPGDAPHPDQRRSLRAGLRIVLSQRQALAGLAFGLLLGCSNEIVNIVYAPWMEGAFGVKIAALSAASAVFGLAELAGEGLVAVLVDRLGKRRAVALGVGSYALACLLLPLLAISLEGAVFGLFLFYLTFEFTVVGYLPLMTQLVPSARATLMASNTTAVSLGRTLGSLIGLALVTFGLHANALASAACNIMALILLVTLVKEGGERHG